MRLDSKRNRVYHNCYGVYWLLAVGGWVKCSMNCSGRDAVLRCNKATYADMLFILCTEEELYTSRLSSITRSNLILTNEAPGTHSLYYVAFTSPYSTLHFVTHFDYWWKEIFV